MSVAASGMLLVMFGPLADLSYDAAAQAKPGSSLTNLVLVYIDESTLTDLPSENGGLNRRYHAQLLDRLTEKHARLVFYDFVFENANQNPRIDQRLAGAIRTNGSVILIAGCQDSIQQGNVPVTSFFPPLNTLRDAARGWGQTELSTATVRLIPGDYQYIPSAVWVAATNLEQRKFSKDDPNRVRWLNYYGERGTQVFSHCSLQDALTNDLPAGFFDGKIVFVGQDFPSDRIGSRKDTFDTPFSRFGAPPMPGVDIQAMALENLLRNDWLREVPWLFQFSLAMGWAIALSTTLFALSQRSRIGMIFTAILGATLLVGASLYVQWDFHWWWSWFGPAFGQTSLALALALWSPKAHRHLAFISYRTEDDGAAALLIAKSLSELGHKTFIDVTSLKMGRFDEQLLREIESARVFIIILSPLSLARCVQKDDWVLRELSHALAKRKHIIPVMKGGFSFASEELALKIPEIAALGSYQGVPYSNSDFEGFIRKLSRLMLES